jgi:glycosyltransferase involved in cell wall biosynthesis
MRHPTFSVVTPFHNTASYLAECIESVLGQSETDFEYLLVDNCSSDGSTEIAERYARADARIRMFRRPQVLSQVQNYNGALEQISANAEFCKIVQADDRLFPDCLRLMRTTFEQSHSVGLVSSYYLKGDVIFASGFPWRTPLLPGTEVARLYLRTGLFVFGSPSTVAYRATLVREQQPFYDETLLHEDTEKCFQILQRWDFGFVPQVLSFLRVGNESSQSLAVRHFCPDALDRYILVQRYATAFLEPGEAATLRRRVRRDYYRALSAEALRLKPSRFWAYHREGLATIGETLDRGALALGSLAELGRLGLNPGATASRLTRRLARRYSAGFQSGA